MTDLGRLRDLAEKATPGERKHEGHAQWYFDDTGEYGSEWCEIPGVGNFYCSHDNTGSGRCEAMNDAEFIAACNPQTVLSLLDRIEVLKEQVENLIPIADEYYAKIGDCGCDWPPGTTCPAHEAVEEAHKVLKEFR